MLQRFRPRRDRSGRESPASFEVAALAHVDALFGAALRLTRNRADADDLLQETYLRAWRASHRFEPGSNLKAWLFTIMNNVHRNARRDRGRSPVDIDTEAAEGAAGSSGPEWSPEEQLMRSALDADLQAALDALPEPYRQAVWLRDVEEFSYAEIAEIAAIPVGTVMSRISRGRRQLHDHLVARTGKVPAGQM